MSEQLTNSELNWIEGWVDALDADTYAAAILRKLVASVHERDEARQEVARLREALGQIEKCEGAFSRDPLTHAENVLKEHERLAQEALQSAPPASEPEDGWTDYWRAINNATGPAPADRPECSVCNDAPTLFLLWSATHPI